MTSVYSSVDIDNSLKRILSFLNDIYVSKSSKFVTSHTNKTILNARIQILFNAKFTSVLDRVIYEILMTHAVKAEKLGPGGFNRCIELVLEKLASHRCGNQPKINKTFEMSSRVATSSDIDQIIENNVVVSSDVVKPMIKTALSLAGFGGRIIIEKTSSNVHSVELVRGYTFELEQILPIDVNLLRPRISCIDGYIENVSEVHHLFEAASEAKEPCVIFLRGMSEDVKHTLKVNYDRGSLKILPIGVKFDLDGMNTLVDVATVSGCDLVSSLKGDLISNIRFSELPIVDAVHIFRGKVVIIHGSTNKRVASHVKQLKTRRESQETVEDVGFLLDKRIKSLSPNHVVIRLQDDKNFIINSQAIDYSLRAIRSTVDRGVTINNVPVTTEWASQVHADRCINTLCSMGAMITTDQNLDQHQRIS